VNHKSGCPRLKYGSAGGCTCEQSVTLVKVLEKAPNYRTKLEARYADHLNMLKAAGQVAEWRYEPMSLRIAEVEGRGASYKPDFALVTPSRVLEFHEVKGSWSMKNARDSRVRLKVAADRYPWFVFKAVMRVKGAWEFEAFTKEPDHGG